MYIPASRFCQIKFRSGQIISVNGIPIDALDYFGIYELLADTSINEYQFLVVTNDGDTEVIAVSIPS